MAKTRKQTKPIYIPEQKITLAVDCIIFGFNDNRLELLLIHRGFEPNLGQWSLMGGFVKNDENLDDAANRVLKNLSGLESVYMEQVKAFGDVNRDPNERVVSTAYSALILKKEYNDELIKKHNAEWFPVDNLPELIFDHEEMVAAAMRRLKRRVRVAPIGFKLLPEKFTLTQLQSLYEAILDETLDKRNFRKKTNQMDFLVRTSEKDRFTSKRGAYLYKFDKKKYRLSEEYNL